MDVGAMWCLVVYFFVLRSPSSVAEELIRSCARHYAGMWGTRPSEDRWEILRLPDDRVTYV